MKKFQAHPWPSVQLDEIKAPKRYALNGGPFGSKLVTRDYAPNGVPVIRGSNLSEDDAFSFNDFVYVSEEKADELLPNNAHPGDLIFTQRGTLGQVGLIPKDCGYKRFVISQSQMKLTVDETKANPYFLYCYFRAPRTVQTILNLAFSSGVPHINLDILRKFEVRLPPLLIQRKIAAILSAYDDLIENNTRRIKILEEMAQMIYREWFVHFRFPGQEKVKMVNSTLGKIPEEWEVKPLKDVCELVNYGYTTSAKQEAVGPKFLRITDIVPYLIDWGSVPHCELAEKDLPKYKLEEGDIVIARTGATTGYAKRINKRHPEAVFASYLVRIRVGNEYSNHYIGLIVESDDYKRFIKTNLGGAAQPQANAQVLTSLPVLVPPKALQNRFDSIVADIFDQREYLQAKNLNLRRTRDLLLPKLISGEVEVEDVEPIIGENMT